MTSQIVITGIGIVSALGIGKDQNWQNACSGKNYICQVSTWNTITLPLFAGQLKDLKIENYLPRRLSKKLDPFAQYALIASKEAIEDSRIQTFAFDERRVGVFVSNMFGGWHFADRELRHLYTEGADAVNPYLATAWFPAAPQGEITILNGFKGYSKTIDGGKAGGLLSIGYAARALQQGKADIIIAGGAEAMINPFMMATCYASSRNSDKNRLTPSNHFEPFSTIESGWAPGEGSAFLMLERIESARKRQAKIYAEICAFNHGHHSTSHRIGLERSISNVLQQAKYSPEEIDLIYANGAGSIERDEEEASAIRKYFDRPVVSVPKSMCGHLGGAAGALDIALAALSLKNNKVPPTVCSTEIDDRYELDVITKQPRSMPLNKILINAASPEGTCASLIIQKCNSKNTF